MLKWIKYKIAAFFAAITLICLLLSGMTQVVLEYRSDIRRADAQLAADAQRIMSAELTGDVLKDVHIPAVDQGRVRLFDKKGKPIVVGLIFQNTPSFMRSQPWFLDYGNQHYRVLTFPILNNGERIGFLQIGQQVRKLQERLSTALLPLLAVSGLLTLLVFFVGLRFEKKAMQPAQESLENMQQFAQHAGHELKTPLANMRSSLELALKTKDYTEGIEEARYEIEHMTALIDVLLQIETLQASSLSEEAVNISLLAEETAQAFKARADEKQVTISADCVPGIVRLGDSELVRTALANLIQNALKFTAANGRITILVRPKYLQVEDTGIGMAPEVAERVFDRFFKADFSRNSEGFGLGLALVKRICDVHGWEIKVDSTLNEGTCFTIRYG